MLNDSISINETAVAVREAQMVLNSVLGYDESYEISPVLEENLPDVYMDYDLVMAKALENSTFNLDNEINLLNAEAAVAQAKASRGISMSLNARFGLSQTAPAFGGVYSDLLDQEVVGLSFSVPIFDWGLGKGKVQKAKAAQEVVRAQVQQSENDFRRQIFTAVGQFNNQRHQCSVSKRAMLIAQERYELMMEKFRSGKASVMELNTAQSENDTALQKYITDVSNFWEYYYTLRQYTLYDFIKGCIVFRLSGIKFHHACLATTELLHHQFISLLSNQHRPFRYRALMSLIVELSYCRKYLTAEVIL